MGHFHDWVAYLMGALSALLSKWYSWCETGKDNGKSYWTSTKEWLDITKAPDQISWLATIGVVWCLGYVYLARLRTGWEWLDQFPVAMPFAFLLGVIMEFTSPAAFKWLLSKLPWGKP